MLAYHIIVIGGLVVAIILLALAVRDQAKVNRWWQETWDLTATDDELDDGLSNFDREVRGLHDDPLD